MGLGEANRLRPTVEETSGVWAAKSILKLVAFLACSGVEADRNGDLSTRMRDCSKFRVRCLGGIHTESFLGAEKKPPSYFTLTWVVKGEKIPKVGAVKFLEME